MTLSSLSNFGVLDRQLNQNERWVCFLALFFFGLAAVYNLFKATPALAFIGDDLGFSSANLGLIMSTYSVATLALAYPGMLIMQRIGVKASVLIAGILMLSGTLIGAFALNPEVFLLGRIVEGCAFGLMCVNGPNIATRLFPPKNLTFAMGIWSLWTPVGTIIAFLTAPLIFDAAGWRPIWFASLLMQAIALALVLTCVKMPRVSENELIESSNTNKGKKPQRNFMLAAIIASVAFFAWVYLYVGNVNSLYPMFLQQVKGMSVFDSAMLSNVIAIITIPLCILFGILSGKFNARKWFIVVGYLAIAVIMFFFAFTPGQSLAASWIFCIIMGVCGASVPMGTLAIIPLLVPDPKKSDFALATFSFVIGIAQVSGIIASITVAELGWQANGMCVLAPLALLAAILSALFIKSDRKVMKIREEELAT